MIAQLSGLLPVPYLGMAMGAANLIGKGVQYIRERRGGDRSGALRTLLSMRGTAAHMLPGDIGEGVQYAITGLRTLEMTAMNADKMNELIDLAVAKNGQLEVSDMTPFIAEKMDALGEVTPEEYRRIWEAENA